jgi:Skp family chaperone for outer membrane proteins
MMIRSFALAVAAAAVLAATGCASTYYATMENFGFAKREILVDRVKDARKEQAETQEVFASALDEFRSLVDIQGGELEKQYDKMNASYDGAKRQAQEVRDRIKAVDDVGQRLFREWDKELDQYESADLRRRSAEQLAATRADYEQLLAAMNKAASKMDPVLELYQDQVLFLKHNLNARAISSLELEKSKIEERVETLIEEMNAAIAEADAFINSMGAGKT